MYINKAHVLQTTVRKDKKQVYFSHAVVHKIYGSICSLNL